MGTVSRWDLRIVSKWDLGTVSRLGGNWDH